MPMRRREKFVTGLVNFPVDSGDYEHSKEGGMFVRVMVLETPGDGRTEELPRQGVDGVLRRDADRRHRTRV